MLNKNKNHVINAFSNVLISIYQLILLFINKTKLSLPLFLSRIIENYKLIYVPVSIILLLISPILFLFFNVFSLCILLYYHVDYIELLKINIVLMAIWFLLFSCYSYVLTHEPSIPLYSGDIITLNNENLVLIVGYSTKFPSLCRATFVETIVLIHLLSNVLGWYPSIYLF